MANMTKEEFLEGVKAAVSGEIDFDKEMGEFKDIVTDVSRFDPVLGEKLQKLVDGLSSNLKEVQQYLKDKVDAGTY